MLSAYRSHDATQRQRRATYADREREDNGDKALCYRGLYAGRQVREKERGSAHFSLIYLSRGDPVDDILVELEDFPWFTVRARHSLRLLALLLTELGGSRQPGSSERASTQIVDPSPPPGAQDGRQFIHGAPLGASTQQTQPKSETASVCESSAPLENSSIENYHR